MENKKLHLVVLRPGSTSADFFGQDVDQTINGIPVLYCYDVDLSGPYHGSMVRKPRTPGQQGSPRSTQDLLIALSDIAVVYRAAGPSQTPTGFQP
ncbi:hypothetical protein [Cupriavidus sp. RAF12]|uniref:hypothetical protein n=1 Tax=Cupriavidus sp. RAF12 TaxID=3233050 RepID=UPI003F8E74AF